MRNSIRQFFSFTPVPAPANHNVNQPGSTSHPPEAGSSRQIGSGSSGPLQRSSLQMALMAQVSSQPKSKEEYVAEWDTWAKQPKQARKENRKEAVKRMKTYLTANYKQLDLAYLGLTSLPSLPASLQALNVHSNKLTSLPSLPNSIQDLDVSYN